MRFKLLLISCFIFTTQLIAQKPMADSMSYALGVQISTHLQQGKLLDKINLQIFSEAMKDLAEGKSRLTNEQCVAAISNFLQKQHNEIKSKNQELGNAFLEKNKTGKGVNVLASGLQYTIVTPGNSNKPKITDEVEVHYKGMLLDNKEFDSSYARNEPAKFPLNRVIQGWGEGLQFIGEGGKIILFVPPQLAYGENSPQGSIIEPNSVLIFEIELLKVFKQEEALITPRPILPPQN